MIPKGNQRGGGQQLAAHLLNTFDNDRAELVELRGAVAPDLSGAFSEWHAQSKATKATKYLYSLSLNPDLKQKPLTREQYYDFIARTEKRMGLGKQPRAVVRHVKYGREHFHVVWSRIDTDKMIAVPMSHDRQKLRSVAQEFAKDHGIKLPPGMEKNKGRDRFEDKKNRADLGEKQQEERTGFDKKSRVKSITDAWNTTRTGEEFIRALAVKDYFLARGDRRGYVVVDLAGEIHGLSRQIKGANTAAIKERLRNLPPDRLPDAARARAHAKELREHRARKVEPEKAGPSPAERRETLRQQHAMRRLVIDMERDKIELRQATERGQLLVLQASENAGIAAGRQDRKPSKITAFLMRVTGIGLLVDMRERAADRDRARDHARQLASLELRQANERQEQNRTALALDRLETRERNALETKLRREEFQRIAGPDREKETGTGKARPPEGPAIEQAPPAPARGADLQPTGSPQSPQVKKRSKGLAALFKSLAEGRDAARTPDKPGDKEVPQRIASGSEVKREAPERQREDFGEGAKPSELAPETPASRSLADEFRRQAERRDRDREDDLDRGREKHYRPAHTDCGIRR